MKKMISVFLSILFCALLAIPGGTAAYAKAQEPGFEEIEKYAAYVAEILITDGVDVDASKGADYLWSTVYLSKEPIRAYVLEKEKLVLIDTKYYPLYCDGEAISIIRVWYDEEEDQYGYNYSNYSVTEYNELAKNTKEEIAIVYSEGQIGRDSTYFVNNNGELLRVKVSDEVLSRAEKAQLETQQESVQKALEKQPVKKQKMSGILQSKTKLAIGDNGAKKKISRHFCD
jgi:hypothetical protein